MCRDCPLCDANEYTLLIEHHLWRLVQCAQCGLAYLPEIPRHKMIEHEQDWNESFSRERRRRWLSNPWMRAWTMALMFLKPSRERRAMRRIVRFVPPGRLLDVGCGDGRLAGVAFRCGFEPLGIELSPPDGGGKQLGDSDRNEYFAGDWKTSIWNRRASMWP